MKTGEQLRADYQRKLEYDRKRIKLWKKANPELVKAQRTRPNKKRECTGNPVGRPKGSNRIQVKIDAATAKEIREVLETLKN